MRLVGFFIGFLIIILIDLYTVRGIGWLTKSMGGNSQKIGYILWFAPTAIFLILGLYGVLNAQRYTDTKDFSFFIFLFGFAILFLIPKLTYAVFLLIDDLSMLIQYIVSLFSQKDSAVPRAERMNRLQFLNQAGLVAGTAMLGAYAWGVSRGKFSYRVLREKIAFKNLPAPFHGLKIVQISDAHLGSLNGKHGEELARAMQMINDLEPDLIFFTGDLVNNFSHEAEPWIETFAKLKAKHGKFSILGNHDYGDYHQWDNQEDKVANLKRLFEIHSEMGFRLLLDENEVLEIDGERIGILGVHNWGKGFKAVGDLQKAIKGTENLPFKLLLSHDPTHFEEQIMGKEAIDLTMSGHTHGMQMGVEIPSLGIKFSPVSLRYKRWGGLYREADNYLYVNRGLGFLAFPGRVGMPPEITFIELETSA